MLYGLAIFPKPTMHNPHCRPAVYDQATPALAGQALRELALCEAEMARAGAQLMCIAAVYLGAGVPV